MRARAAADVQDPGRRRREHRSQQLLRPQQLEPVARHGEPPGLDPGLGVERDERLVGGRLGAHLARAGGR
ncbi:MAG TPA: hypothetical protein VF533_11040 [Solirubrobacteraceae bacterium]